VEWRDNLTVREPRTTARAHNGFRRCGQL